MYINGDYISLADALPEYTEVAEFGEYGYDWSIMKIYRRDSRLFALTASGCSCNDFNDTWSSPEEAIQDMVELPTLEAARRFYEEWNGPSWYAGPKWLDAAEKFRELGLR